MTSQNFALLVLNLETHVCVCVAFASCRGDTEFTCDNGRCVPLTVKCNGINNCRDNSDEKPDLCGESLTTLPLSTL